MNVPSDIRDRLVWLIQNLDQRVATRAEKTVSVRLKNDGFEETLAALKHLMKLCSSMDGESVDCVELVSENIEIATVCCFFGGPAACRSLAERCLALCDEEIE